MDSTVSALSPCWDFCLVTMLTLAVGYTLPVLSSIFPIKLKVPTWLPSGPDVTKYSRSTTSPSFTALPTLSSPNLISYLISSVSDKKYERVVGVTVATVSARL